MSLNLHQIVRGVVTFNNADRPLMLFRSVGTFSRDPETMENVPNVMNGELVFGQMQSMSADEIVQSERVSFSTTIRKVYLRTPSGKRTRAWGMWRPLSRTGDYLQDEGGNFWYVDAVLEDFSESGWVALQAILQTTKPHLLIVHEAYDDDSRC